MNLIYKMKSGKELLVKESSSISHIDKIVSSFDNQIDELDDYFEIICGKKAKKLASYKKMANVLSLTPDELFMSLPKNKINEFLEKHAEQLEAALETLENREYLVTYLTIKRFLRGLSRPLVDHSKLGKIISKEDYVGVKNAMTSFLPGPDGFCKRSIYSMVGSSTGRLTIANGPNILTMKSIARKAIQSRYKNGGILQLDLTAAEPTIALNFAGKTPPPDVYRHISQKVLDNKVSRDDAKLIVLCALYGQSPKKLQERLPSTINAKNIINKCRDYFEVKNLERTLLLHQRENSLRNAVGRPLTLGIDEKRLLVSYFLQSSAAEMSILLFSDLCEELKKNKSCFVPLYVIHDALIIDCDNTLYNDLLKKGIVNLCMGDWSFKAKVTNVSREED